MNFFNMFMLSIHYISINCKIYCCSNPSIILNIRNAQPTEDNKSKYGKSDWAWTNNDFDGHCLFQQKSNCTNIWIAFRSS